MESCRALTRLATVSQRHRTSDWNLAWRTSRSRSAGLSMFLWQTIISELPLCDQDPYHHTFLESYSVSSVIISLDIFRIAYTTCVITSWDTDTFHEVNQECLQTSLKYCLSLISGSLGNHWLVSCSIGIALAGLTVAQAWPSADRYTHSLRLGFRLSLIAAVPDTKSRHAVSDFWQQRQNKISCSTFVIECLGFGLFGLKPLKTI